MGHCASLFFSAVNAEDTLHYRIKPSDDQVTAQQERWNDVADTLISEVSQETGCSVNTWLQGSYKFGTQIRPARKGDEFDIDLGIYVTWLGDANDGAYTAAELRSIVEKFLKEYVDQLDGEAAVLDEPKPRCSRIKFNDDFHIDVPVYHLWNDVRTLATLPNTWEGSDPKALYIWWKDLFSDGERARARRLVRYIKMWSAINLSQEERPSSVLLTVLVANALCEICPETISGDDEFLYAVVKSVRATLQDNRVVSNPVDRTEDLNRLGNAFDEFVNSLASFEDIAERAVSGVTTVISAEIWAEAFGHFFPIPDEDLVDEAVLRSFDCLPVPFTFDPVVLVCAEGQGKTINGVNRIGPVPRKMDIRFKIGNAADLPPGATVHWTARNSGTEAEAVNDLGHASPSGIETEETTAYRGTHSMDVVVRLHGRIIGRRRVPVVVSGPLQVLRNPPRPAWAALNRKR